MNLKDLSNLLGLSQTTVSRALNGYPEVSEETRIRVCRAAKKFSYRPNLNATRLATGRSMAIGHVIPVSSSNEMVNPVFADFLAGAGETCGRAGYDLLLSVVNDENHERAYKELADRGAVDGVIVQLPSVKDGRIGMLQQMGLPFVVHGRSSEVDSDYSWLDVDNRTAFRRATAYLARSGHRRIALLNGLETLDFAKRRRLGYESGLRENGLEPDPALIRSGDMTENAGHDAAAEMLGWPDPPSAFLSSSILTAIGARRAIQEAGLELGVDAAIVTHDDELSYLKNSGALPLFTATRSSVRNAGRRCAELLLGLIENPDSGPVHELWETEFVHGASTAAEPAEARSVA